MEITMQTIDELLNHLQWQRAHIRAIEDENYIRMSAGDIGRLQDICQALDTDLGNRLADQLGVVLVASHPLIIVDDALET